MYEGDPYTESHDQFAHRLSTIAGRCEISARRCNEYASIFWTSVKRRICWTCWVAEGKAWSMNRDCVRNEHLDSIPVINNIKIMTQMGGKM